MQSQTFFIKFLFIFIFFWRARPAVRIDVDPVKNSLKIQLDEPTPFVVTPPLMKDVSPVLTIGILTLDISPNTEKTLRSKYEKKQFNDFDFSDINQTVSDKEEIFNFLQNIDKYTMLARSYSKFLTFYKNVYTVPMNMLAGPQYLTKLMEGLDGVLLTGGASQFYVKEKIKIDQKPPKAAENVQRKNSVYFKTVIEIIKKAKEINDSGRIFPIWGTCLGFEAMILNEAPPEFKFDTYKDIKKTHSVVLTDDSGTPLLNIQKNPFAGQNSEMEMSLQLGTQELNLELLDHRVTFKQSAYNLPIYSSFADFMRTEFLGQQQQKLFYFYHHYGFSPSKFKETPSLAENFQILSISDEHDFVSPSRPYSETNDKLVFSHPLVKNIKEMVEQNSSESSFVSAIEHKKYPFWGVQFHPEKPLFDFQRNDAVRHDGSAIEFNRKFSTFFVQRLRAAKVANAQKKKVVRKLDKLMTSLSKFQVKNVGLYSELLIFKQAFSLDL